MDELLLGDELDRREDRDDHKGVEHDGRAVALVEFLEGLPVEQGHEHRGVLIGRVPRVDQQVDRIELLERAHGTHQDHEEQRRRDHRDRDMEEGLDPAGAVDLRRFIVALGDALKAGQDQHQVIADRGPDPDDGTGDQCRVRIRQPAGPLDPERAEGDVQDAVLGVIDPAPDHGHRGGCHDHGQEIDAAVDVPAADLAVQQGSEDQRKQHADRHGEHHVEERVDRCVADHIVREELFEVLQPDIDLRAEALGLVEAAADRVKERIDVQNEQADNGRRDQDKSSRHDLGIIAFPAAEARRSGFGRYGHRVPDLLSVNTPQAAAGMPRHGCPLTRIR